MNDPIAPTGGATTPPSREEMMSAMFANMVIQQTNMAMMLLGKVAHPETGQFMQDLEAAKMFIDQLEMLAAKTKGNLNRQEEGLLKQALSALQMSFVEAIEAPGAATEAGAPAAHVDSVGATPASAPAESAPAAPPAAAKPEADESRKKFSKKY